MGPSGSRLGKQLVRSCDRRIFDMTTWRENPIPLSGKVHRCQGGFCAPQRRDGRSPVHGSRRCLHQRHARADPLASQEDGCSPVSTASHQRRRINHRGHRRLALLGGPRLLLLNHRQDRVLIYAGLPKAHVARWRIRRVTSPGDDYYPTGEGHNLLSE